MRSLIRRGVGPLFEAVVSRLDPSVDPAEHSSFVAGVLAKGDLTQLGGPAGTASLVARCCGSIGLEPPAWAAASGEGASLGESEPLRSLFAPAASLTAKSSSVASASSVPPSFEDEPRVAAAGAEEMLQGIWSGEFSLDEAVTRTRALANGLDSKRWFLLKRGALYGSADFLRGLLQLCAGAVGDTRLDPLREYARAVLDSAIRHLEVRREAALEMAQTSLTPDADSDLERIRFSLALLAGSAVFDDARYLNTALKTQDWHLRRLQHAKARARDARWRLRFLFYLAALAQQEEAMRRAFPC